MKTATIEIYRIIGKGIDPDTGIPYLSDEEIAWRLQMMAPDVEEIELLFNSPGGDIATGMAIFNMLRGQKRQTLARAYGNVASIASIIAMGCNRFVMHPGSQLMIHETGIRPGISSADELENMAELARTTNTQAADIYVKCNRKGISLKDVQNLMARETWMDPKRALELGFCDEIAEETAQVSLCAIPQRFGYKNVPAFMQQSRQCAGENHHTEVQNMHEKTKQFLAKLCAKLGLSGGDIYDPEKFDHEAALSKVDSLLAPPPAVASIPEAAMKALALEPTAKSADFIGAVFALKNRTDMVPAVDHAKVLAENKALRRDALLMQAVHVDRKLSAVQVEEGSELRKLADENPDAFKATVDRLPKFEMKSGIQNPPAEAGGAGTSSTVMREKFCRMRQIGCIDPAMKFERFLEIQKKEVR